MFTNYLKTAFRSLLKNKGFTVLNGLGLALGIATCLLIVFYVLDDLSYDRYNEKADRIYRVNNQVKFGGNGPISTHRDPRLRFRDPAGGPAVRRLGLVHGPFRSRPADR